MPRSARAFSPAPVPSPSLPRIGLEQNNPPLRREAPPLPLDKAGQQKKAGQQRQAVALHDLETTIAATSAATSASPIPKLGWAGVSADGFHTPPPWEVVGDCCHVSWQSVVK